jgi:hypothetical protein
MAAVILYIIGNQRILYQRLRALHEFRLLEVKYNGSTLYWRNFIGLVVILPRVRSSHCNLVQNQRQMMELQGQLLSEGSAPHKVFVANSLFAAWYPEPLRQWEPGQLLSFYTHTHNSDECYPAVIKPLSIYQS